MVPKYVISINRNVIVKTQVIEYSNLWYYKFTICELAENWYKHIDGNAPLC